MKILITGGAGYIGSVMVRRLVESSVVTVVDTFRNAPTSIIDLCRHRNLELVKGDVRDPGLMKNLYAAADVIIPLAAIVGKPACDLNPSDTQTVNVDAAKILVDCISNNQHVIYPNTNSGYGTAKEEDIYTEESPLNPISTYGITKCIAEDLILNSKASHTIFRLATVYGLSICMRLDLMVNDFVYRAVKDKCITIFEPHFKRNFVHIEDVVNAFYLAVQNDAFKNEIFNVGKTNISKRELCYEIRKQIPNFIVTESEYNNDADKRNYTISTKKIESIAGYREQQTLENGISELIKAFKILTNEKYSNVK